MAQRLREYAEVARPLEDAGGAVSPREAQVYRPLARKLGAGN